MVQGQAGKGDAYRPQSAAEKRQYDINYLRVFGDPCPDCKTTGVCGIPDFEGTTEVCTMSYCQTCKGLGYVEKRKVPKQM
jgi:DnaJ-class molecular chaperone